MLTASNPFPPEFETPDPKPLEPFDPIANPGDYCFALAYSYSRDNPPQHIPDRCWQEDYGNP